LANKLQKVILSVIHANQYGFLKGRIIQDFLAWAFQFLHLCHHNKKEIVIVKLDFEKAFDKVEHQAILEMMRHKGFSNKWIHWIELILSSTSFSVLLNGVPGKPFKCKRGVRQGDPLSPLLFVIAADLLQFVVNSAIAEGLYFTHWIMILGGDYPIVQYADDTLLNYYAS
jgi:retron-type reverse transcriptase